MELSVSHVKAPTRAAQKTIVTITELVDAA